MIPQSAGRRMPSGACLSLSPLFMRIRMPIHFQRFRLRKRKSRVESVGLFMVLVFMAWLSPLGADEPGSSTKDDHAALQAAAALYDGIRTETLPNGLRVYLKPIPGSPVVT